MLRMRFYFKYTDGKKVYGVMKRQWGIIGTPEYFICEAECGVDGEPTPEMRVDVAKPYPHAEAVWHDLEEAGMHNGWEEL